MPRRSAYAGRHRGRHRAEVTRPTRGVALPGAAAAVLTLTATGAAVVPGLGAANAATEAGAPAIAPLPQVNTQAHHDQDRVIQAALTEQARQAREVARERASRDEARAAIEKKRQAAQRWVMPLAHFTFSSDYGMRWGKLHAGDDLAAPTGTRIGSLSSGTVTFAGYENGYGNKVEVRHWDGTVSWYGHMSRITVKVGQTVAPGDKLGEVGSTGHSTGPHLHLEIHPNGGGSVDPRPWLAAHGVKF